MKYSEIRDQIQDGDIALVSGSGPFSLLVRMLTAGSWSHVAVLYHEDNCLWVSEVREFTGHRITHASTWLDQQLTSGKLVKFGIAPERVRGKAFVPEFIDSNRTKIKKYSFVLLPLVWLSRVTGIGFQNAKGFICSIYVQKVWRHSGRALFPSDLANLCHTTHSITEL